MLNSALTIIYLVAVVNNPEVVSRNPVSSASVQRRLDQFWAAKQPAGGPQEALKAAATTSSKGLKFSFPDFRRGWNRFLGAPFGLIPPTLISRAKDAFLVLLIRMFR